MNIRVEGLTADPPLGKSHLFTTHLPSFLGGKRNLRSAQQRQREPEVRIEQIFRAGTCSRDYVKPRDAERILRENDLAVAAAVCPELRALLNTILQRCAGECV